jgi:hypothetical protein
MGGISPGLNIAGFSPDSRLEPLLTGTKGVVAGYIRGESL